MRILSSRICLPALLACASLASRAQALLPEVQERILKNGVRVLSVERPGTGVLHARFFLRGGASQAGPLPPLAARLLASALDAPAPLVWADLEPLLRQEAGAHEALRLARIQKDRGGAAEPQSEVQGLEVLRRQALDRIRELGREARMRDPMDALGVTNRVSRAEADYLTWGADLPKASLGAWCRHQVEALKAPRLAWFPLDRERLLLDLDRGPDGVQASHSVLLGTALTGRAYAQVWDAPRSAAEALNWSEMVAYARRAISPDRLLLVLVGDLQRASVAAELDATVGALPGEVDGGRSDSFAGEQLEAPGARRLQANTSGDRRLLMAWRVPPLSHPDTPLIQVLARMLGGGRSSRLVRSVVAERRLASSLTVRTGLPGGRQAGLLLVEAVPEPEHALAELEQAIQGEVMRFQQELIPGDEIRRAQRWVEADEVLAQEDAAGLAGVLGAAHCEGGDWRLAFRGLQLARDYSSEEIRGVARRYLVPAQATTALLEPDPILNPMDRQEARMVHVLTQLLATRLQDPAQSEAVIRETLRQIRMLPAADQEKTLKLLESQVKP